jgi:multidrug efflux pump
MPEGVNVFLAVDRADFVRESVKEVYKTLFFAFGLVILVVFFFLRSARATIIPLIAVPVSVVGTFFFMNLLGFSINILTLLALVLAVGLVIDDAIVMLENIYRRVEEGENPLKAAYLGSRQVAFAIIATTLSLIAVFIPVAFQQGSTGRLFYEFGITLALAVSVSSFVALTLTPMLCSKYLRSSAQGGIVPHSRLHRWTEPAFVWANGRYAGLLNLSLRGWPIVLAGAAVFGAAGFLLYPKLQRELVPLEDRGVFISFFRGPQGAGPDYTRAYIKDMEDLVADIPEIVRNFSISAFGFGAPGLGNQGIMFTGLKHWDARDRTTQEIVGEVAGKYGQQITGGMAFPVPLRPLGQRGAGQDINFVLLGQDYEELQAVGGDLLQRMQQSGLFLRPRLEPEMNKPQLDVQVHRQRAADLGVEVRDVATTLETLLGGRRVTQFKRGNLEYEVIVQIEDTERTSPNDLNRLYVRSSNGSLIQLGNLVEAHETLVPENYPHFNRLRAVKVVAQMQQGHTIGDGVNFLEEAAVSLPQGISRTWDGVSREFVDAEGATLFLFGLALVFAFLVLSAQFESFVHPLTIFSGVVLAISGGLAILYASRFWGEPLTDNLFSRFGLIMLIGLVAKNGILIVEFANQLQIEGRNAFEAARQAAILRFRPILMTAITTICGVMPLALASGAGAETRNPLGIVIIGGLGLATLLTLFVVPVIYILFDRMVVKVTGHSSAHGLKRSREIPREMAEVSD